MTLNCIGHNREYDLQSIAGAFFPGQPFSEGLPLVESRCTFADNKVICKTSISDEKIKTEAVASFSNDDIWSVRNAVKESFFNAAYKFTGIIPPWGEFSGIRPVKYMSSLAENPAEARNIFVRDLRVSEQKANLCFDTLKFREKLSYPMEENDFSLYISIPFCPSRCSYCSFISQAAEKMLSMIPDYLSVLCDEIKRVGDVAKNSGLTLRSIYMGDGTPGILSAEQLSHVCKTVENNLDLSGLLEYTVELGRPDVITKEKLIAVKAFGVDRISINPQTLSEDVLQKIGRKHTAKQFYDAYDSAVNVGFKSINTDIIVGLPSDTLESFDNTLNGILAISPENITVHSLCLKKSSWLRVDRETEFLHNKNAIEMSKSANNAMRSNGYNPYYIYKQKNAIGALENTGFCRDNLAGYYNIVMMDDLQTVIGVGAGSASKLMLNGKLNRIYNHKYPFEYIERGDRTDENLKTIGDFFNNK